MWMDGFRSHSENNGTSSNNCPIFVPIFYGSMLYNILFAYVIKVISHYYLNVLPMSMMGFQLKKSLVGG